jgi:predicted transcriptional regulator
MPKVNKMVRRCVVVDDATWKAVAAAAKSVDRSASNWIRQALESALELHEVTTAGDDR